LCHKPHTYRGDQLSGRRAFGGVFLQTHFQEVVEVRAPLLRIGQSRRVGGRDQENGAHRMHITVRRLTHSQFDGGDTQRPDISLHVTRDGRMSAEQAGSNDCGEAEQYLAIVLCVAADKHSAGEKKHTQYSISALAPLPSPFAISTHLQIEAPHCAQKIRHKNMRDVTSQRFPLTLSNPVLPPLPAPCTQQKKEHTVPAQTNTHTRNEPHPLFLRSLHSSHSFKVPFAFPLPPSEEDEVRTDHPIRSADHSFAFAHGIGELCTNAEVGEFALTGVCQQNVATFDVAMDLLVRVKIVQTLTIANNTRLSATQHITSQARS
jgi:hypothetical protein